MVFKWRKRWINYNFKDFTQSKAAKVSSKIARTLKCSKMTMSHAGDAFQTDGINMSDSSVVSGTMIVSASESIIAEWSVGTDSVSLCALFASVEMTDFKKTGTSSSNRALVI